MVVVVVVVVEIVDSIVLVYSCNIDDVVIEVLSIIATKLIIPINIRISTGCGVVLSLAAGATTAGQVAF